jgi:hypothetical protein
MLVIQKAWPQSKKFSPAVELNLRMEIDQACVYATFAAKVDGCANWTGANGTVILVVRRRIHPTIKLSLHILVVIFPDRIRIFLAWLCLCQRCNRRLGDAAVVIPGAVEVY